MLNKLIMMGRMVRDPEVRKTQAGIPVATFSLAVERDFTDRSTGRKAVDFPKVEAWRQTAEFIEKYVVKGQMVAVEGRMESREWTDKEGKKKVEWVVAADRVYFGGDKKAGGEIATSATPPRNDNGVMVDYNGFEMLDGELPFDM